MTCIMAVCLPSVSAGEPDVLREDVRPSVLPGGFQRSFHADLDGRHRNGDRRAQPVLTFNVRDCEEQRAELPSRLGI